MKSHPRLGKLTLAALLSMGLLCSPLIVNASDGHHNRHGYSQSQHGKSQYKDNNRYRNHGYRTSYRKGYKHGYKSGRHDYRPQRHNDYYADSHRYNGGGEHYGRTSLYFGLFSGFQNPPHYD